ncbi:MlaC/ttg2D family ABC transporter substrate-binding protein [Desulfoferrobacter suflitae]|uniref:MlaC/ttg2D family ABC transporter substrate-binding protein n=1 Tax=Desulfoferrobacter suflitae TaxID=2865782 RepID=UPI0021644B32|nr:ABC transporter substrate-binding protein [Desulfoferrobacter suflitae]MCK8604063.1 ABC transporter substrate-binding protein [Desulfoferrobacter suflitae]
MKMRLMILAVLVVFFMCGAIRSRAGAEEPTERIRAMLEEIMTIQTDPQLEGSEHREERRAAIKQIIGENIDFDAMAQIALDKQWRNLSLAQRNEFKQIFRDLFQDSYSRLVLNFIKREKVLYPKEDVRRDSATVSTVIVRANDEITVDYSLSKRATDWLVDDVKVDGVSIAGNYRNAFDRVIKKESFEALLNRMRLQQKAIAKSP